MSIVIQTHIQNCELRETAASPDIYETGLFPVSQQNKFLEENYVKPQYVYHFVRAPVARLGFLYGIHQVTNIYLPPSLGEIHTFLSDLFVKALLSPECSIGDDCPSFHPSIYLSNHSSIHPSIHLSIYRSTSIIHPSNELSNYFLPSSTMTF